MSVRANCHLDEGDEVSAHIDKLSLTLHVQFGPDAVLYVRKDRHAKLYQDLIKFFTDTHRLIK